MSPVNAAAFLSAILALPAPAWSQAEDQPSLSETATNLETAITTYIFKHNADGKWGAKPKAGGKAVRLEFLEVDKGSIEALSPGVFVSLVRLREIRRRKPRQAEFIVDLGGGDWRVISMRWLGPDERIDYRAAAQRAASAAPPRAASTRRAARKGPKPETSGSLPAVGLTTLGGSKVLLTSCPTEKCLVAVLAPWCPHCHNSVANIKALRDYLKGLGAATRVVVTADSSGPIREFAEEFGDDTLLDPARALTVPGFPCYMVTDDEGGIIKQTSLDLEGSVDLARTAEALGLP
jgi:hypothetical protein